MIDILVRGALGGLMQGLMGAGGKGIFNALNKKRNRMIKELSINFDIQKDLSLETKWAIIKLLERIAKCDDDGLIHKKEFSVFLIIVQMLGLDKVRQRTIEAMDKEFDKLSNDELLEYLSNFEWECKEWFIKTIIYTVESDQETIQQKINRVEPILSNLGISKEKYNEIKNKISQNS